MHALLSPRLKLWIHLAEIGLILPVIILTIVRVTMGVSLRGTGRIGLAFGAKSLVFIAYQLLTEHVQALKRWRSLKAYAIINGIEIVFWGAVVYLTMAGLIGKTCNGTTCALGWVIVVCAILMCPLTTWLFAISWFDFKAYRARGNKHLDELDGDEAAAAGVHTSELPKYESAGTTDRSRQPSPDVRDPRIPMVQQPGAPHYDPRYNYQHHHQHHESTEYHSGYARTPTQIV